MTTRYEKLLRVAKKLEAHHNTEWTDEHDDVYDAFADKIERLRDRGSLTKEQFKALALTAFYDCDYDFDE